MSQFTVIKIIDGDTFEVSPNWKWNGNNGLRVRPTGFDAPELPSYEGQVAAKKLSNLIRGKVVSLGDAYRVDRGRIVCDVYLNGKYLAEYFPEYQ